MMQSALKIQTTVSAEGKIEIAAPELLPGKAVEVIVLLATDTPDNQLSAMAVLNQASGTRQFETEPDVAAYLRRERDAWDS